MNRLTDEQLPHQKVHQTLTSNPSWSCCHFVPVQQQHVEGRWMLQKKSAHAPLMTKTQQLRHRRRLPSASVFLLRPKNYPRPGMSLQTFDCVMYLKCSILSWASPELRHLP